MATLSHFQNKINKAGELKGEGNVFFKEGQYDNARAKYQQALQLLEPSTFYGATEEECHKLAQVSASLLFNVGTCCFNQQKWKDAEILYNEALTINPYYVKALYKRAMARFQLAEYEGAMTDIKTAHQLDKTNEDIHNAYQKIRQKFNEDVRKSISKQKEMNSKIFSPKKESSKEIQPKEKKQQDSKESSWWWLALTPLAAAAIYHGIKFWRKS